MANKKRSRATWGGRAKSGEYSFHGRSRAVRARLLNQLRLKVARLIGWAMVPVSVMLLTACGGGSSPPPPPPPTEGSATIGAAGGTVSGPDGVQLVVPPGALDADVTIRIARSSAGAPALPPELNTGPVMYEMTPHDLRFAVPVQVRIPVAGTIAADAAAFFAAPGGEWATLPADFADGVATIERTSLSWFLVIPSGGLVCSPRPTDPYPCQYVVIAPGPVTTTPAGAIVGNTISLAATLDVPLEFGAARDCGNAQVTVTRYSLWFPGRPPPVQPLTILQQQVSLSNSPTNASRSVGSATFQSLVDSADNGWVSFDVTFWCTREFDGQRRSAVGALRYQVAIAAPPAAPTITLQPADQSVAAGQTATFNVKAFGTALSYQWRKACPATAAPQIITGATGESYTTPATTLADNGCAYTVEVCGTAGSPPTTSCVVSQPALLAVSVATVAPAFTTHPASVSILEGQTASLTAVATGTPAPTIRWYQQGTPPAQVGTPCTGAGSQTSCTFTTPALSVAQSGIRYYAEAANSVGSVASNTATITVQTFTVAPTITTQPASLFVFEGSGATFSVAASGTAPLSYQWRRNGVDLSGANGTSYTLANAQLADSGASFSVLVSNSAGSATSNGALLTVYPAPTPLPSNGICIGSDTAGWCWRQPAPHGNTLTALAFDGGTAHAFGMAGTRMSSADGGATWQTAFGDYDFTDLTSPSPGVLIAVGRQLRPSPQIDGIFRSSDGAQTWTLRLDTSNYTNSVAFSDADNGVAVGAGIWRTTDGGLNWTGIITVPGGGFLHRVTYASANTLIAVGTSGLIMRSVDGGLTWTTPASGSTADLRDVSFGSASIGVAAVADPNANGEVLRTTDGGATWTRIPLPSGGGAFLTVAFADSRTVLALSRWGYVARSTDGGANWSPLAPALGTVQAFTSRLRFRDSTNGTAIGEFGLIMLTTDAGVTWNRVGGGSATEILEVVRFSPAGVGFAAGATNFGRVLRTTDGGLNWALSAPLGGVLDLAFAGSNVIAAGLNGIYRSTDLGQSWSTVYRDNLGNNPRSVDFASAAIGVAVGLDGAVLRTTDGGLTWTPVASGTTAALLTVRFASLNVGHAGGGGTTLLRTTDAGATWSPVAAAPAGENIHSLAYPTAMIAVMAIDSGLLRSTDGGLTWARAYNSVQGSMLGVSFGSATQGVAVGVNGEIARSVDAGATWTFVEQPIALHLRGVAHADANTVIAVGDGGTILRNTQGGVAAAGASVVRFPVGPR